MGAEIQRRFHCYQLVHAKKQIQKRNQQSKRKQGKNNGDYVGNQVGKQMTPVRDDISNNAA